MNDIQIREMYLKALKAFENTDAKNPINHKLIKDTIKKRKNGNGIFQQKRGE